MWAQLEKAKKVKRRLQDDSNLEKLEILAFYLYLKETLYFQILLLPFYWATFSLF